MATTSSVPANTYIEKAPDAPNERKSSKPCSFFAQGTCRNGSDCRFSHDTTAPLYSSPPPGNPVQINIPPNHQVFSIDVECVATGVQHNSRSVAQVALVDEWCRPVFNAFIKQDKPVVSYLTPLTGLTQETLDKYGMPLADAMAILRSFLSPTSILVGQSIQKDVHWLQLMDGIDYHSMINIADMFRVWNQSRGSFTSFSQDHCAKVWLNITDRPHHDAVTDAAISMSLFNTYRGVQWDPNRLYALQQATLQAPRVPGFSQTYPQIDGCCMGNRKNCSCGAPFD